MSLWRAWQLPPESDVEGHERVREATAATEAFRWIEPEPAAFRRLLGRLTAAGDELRRLPAAAVADVLGAVGERFLDDADALRREALDRLPGQAGVSPEQARWTLDGMARDWTAGRLRRLLAAEFGDAGVLDGFRRVERGGLDRRLRAAGPRLGVHVTAGSVPGVSVHSLVRGLLVKGPVLLKPGAGDALLPVLFARGLAGAKGAVAGVVARALAVFYWPGGHDALESAALGAADQVVVYGGDATVRDVARRLGPHQRLVAYAHRVSLAVLGPGALDGEHLERTAAALARAVASFDQRGCVCPHQVFLPETAPSSGPPGAGSRADALVDALAAALEREARALPPGPLEPDEASAVQQARGVEELRQAAGEGVRVRVGERLAWTVVLDSEPRLVEGCLARTVRVTPVPSIDALASLLAPHADHLQSAGVAGFGANDEARLAEALAGAGVTRIASLDQMPFPAPWWLHDGRGPLTELVRWTEWAGGTGAAGAIPPEGGEASSPLHR